MVSIDTIAWQNQRVLVTGATGFIGRYLVKSLLAAQANVEVLVRPVGAEAVSSIYADQAVGVKTADLSDHNTLANVCRHVDTVFHLAGYVHADDNDVKRAVEQHPRRTVNGTQALLKEAVKDGVRRFIFVSSVKAMGESTQGCVDETAAAKPLSAYGRAKLTAENLVLEAGSASGMHVSILRLPVVYGRNNKGNIPRMISAIARGRFPPLPEVGNRRSMVHVVDVVQALMLAASRTVANGQVYIVTDGHPYSSRQIELLIRASLGKTSPSWYVPQYALHLAAWVGDLAKRLLRHKLPLDSVQLQKLLGSACYKNDKIRKDLGFQPQFSLADALAEMVA